MALTEEEKEQLEDMMYANELVDRYYASGGRYRTKEAALMLLRRWRQQHLFLPGPGWSKKDRKKRIHERYITHEISRMIQNSQADDPVYVIALFISTMDNVISRRDSNSSLAWVFADNAVRLCRDILDVFHG